MVLVPCGPFMMGCDDAAGPECNVSSKPAHKVTVPTFEIDEYEVTVARYEACVAAEACTLTIAGEACNWGMAGREQYPLNCATRDMLAKYCAWVGKRLCSESEWEKAARGTDGRRYPWGSEPPTCELAVMREAGAPGCGTNSTMAVGSRPLGASPYGALDMAGSVEEWVADPGADYKWAPTDGSVDEEGDGGVLRGGSYQSTEIPLLAWYRFGQQQTWYNSPKWGGRCCRDAACPGVKDCAGRVCGPDPVCGESCGACPYGQACTAGGACEGGVCAAGCGEMVKVPGGPFMQGCNAAVDAFCQADEKPYHEVDVPPFEIDRYEVTVQQFSVCVDAGLCPPAETYTNCNWGVPGKEDHPVDCVDWEQARLFCAFTGRRLCTESEWEKAARGTDGRIYPWGNEAATCSYAVFNDTSTTGGGCGGAGSTMPVGSKPEGAGPYGAEDMSGNVREWVADDRHSTYQGAPVDGSAWVGPDPHAVNRVVRGGDLYSDPDEVRASRRWSVSWFHEAKIGIRCCRSL
jgi:formylglycine-generating enzyme required for sulfatase activity